MKEVKCRSIQVDNQINSVMVTMVDQTDHIKIIFLLMGHKGRLTGVTQAAQCSLVQNIYFGLQKKGSLCPKNRRKIGNYRPKMAFL